MDKNPDENNILDEDDDDYLLYLEDILRRIHTEFYATIEKEGGRKSLRDIIPRVRAQVLKGVHLTFSGLIPTHQKLHQSRAYKVARAFGAEVAQVIFFFFYFSFYFISYIFILMYYYIVGFIRKNYSSSCYKTWHSKG